MVGSLANLCWETKQFLIILAMVFFICAVVTCIISRLAHEKWKRGFHIFSIILAGVGIVLIILYLLMPSIISWLIGPDILFDLPFEYDPYYDHTPQSVVNCTDGGTNCTRYLGG